jgi:hypothetical protein
MRILEREVINPFLDILAENCYRIGLRKAVRDKVEPWVFKLVGRFSVPGQ